MPPDNVRPSGGNQLVVSSGYGNYKVIAGLPGTHSGHDENTRQTSISLDQLLESLLEPLSEITIAGARDPLSNLLTPLRSYRWFSPEIYQQVGKWGVGALAIVGEARENGPSQKTLIFLVRSMFDRYHYDRALYGASHLPDHPIPQRFDFRAEDSIRDGVPHSRTWKDLESPENIPLEVAHRVAELVVLAKPERFALVTYMVAKYGRYEFPRNLIDPVVYALYNNWAIKVAEWE